MADVLRSTHGDEFSAETLNTSAARQQLHALFEARLARQTCDKLLLLLTAPGELLEVVLCDQHRMDLRVSSLDGGCLKSCFCRFGRSLHDSHAAVAALVRARRTKTASDRWEPWLVERLAAELKCSLDDSPELRSLLGQPKNGALVLSLNGSIVAAAAKLRHGDKAGSALLPDGVEAPLQCAGTLGVAQDLCVAWRSGDAPGVAAVCSDTFGCCLMLPQKAAAPRLVHISAPQDAHK